MSKLLRRLSILVVLTGFLLSFLPKTTQAAQCEFTYYDPAKFNPADLGTGKVDKRVFKQNMGKLLVRVTSTTLAKTADPNTAPWYYFAKQGPIWNGISVMPLDGKDIVRSEVQLIKKSAAVDAPGEAIFTISAIGSFNLNSDQWPTGAFIIYLIDKRVSFNDFKAKKADPNSWCKDDFNIAATPKYNCTSNIEETDIYNDIPVTLRTDGQIPADTYNIMVNGNEQAIHLDSGQICGASRNINCCNTDRTNCRVPLGSWPLSPNDYSVEIRQGCGFNPFSACKENAQPLICNPTLFRVLPKDTSSGAPPPPTTTPQCEISPKLERSTISNIYILAKNLPVGLNYTAETRTIIDGTPYSSVPGTSSPQGTLSILLNNPGGNLAEGGYFTKLLDSNGNLVGGCVDLPFDITDVQKIGARQIRERESCASIDVKTGARGCSSAGGTKLTGCGTADNPGLSTAIGCIHTNPAELAKDLLKFIIGIAGGLAFLMMLLGAYQMLTSAGNPEALKGGQDRLTSAFIGLLFIIFSVLLLQIIGAGVLNLPGFGP